MTTHALQMAQARGIDPRKVAAAEASVGTHSAAVVIWTGREKVQIVPVRNGQATTALFEDRKAIGRMYKDLPVRWL